MLVEYLNYGWLRISHKQGDDESGGNGRWSGTDTWQWSSDAARPFVLDFFWVTVPTGPCRKQTAQRPALCCLTILSLFVSFNSTLLWPRGHYIRQP